MKVRFGIASWIIAVTWIINTGCANMTTPTGGPEDRKAPKVILEDPVNYTVYFQSKSIVIEFDEYIKLQSPEKQVLISPPFKKPPEFVLKGKRLYVTLKDTLLKNTTYTFNFGESLKDVTEGNILKGFRYIFSTGAVVDSLQLRGAVYNAATGQPEKNIPVLLYKKTYDSVIVKERPYYFAQTDEKGQYFFENLKKGTYKLIALDDQNFNLLYDLPNERIAFSDTLVEVKPSNENKEHNLNLYTDEKKLRLLYATSTHFGKIKLIFSKPVEDLQIDQKHTHKKMIERVEYNNRKDTVTYWISDPYVDSVILLLASEKNNYRDTATIKIPGLPTDSAVKESLKIKPLSKQKRVVPEEPLAFTIDRPVLALNKNKLILKMADQIITPDSVFWSSELKRQLNIFYQWKPNTDYKVVFLEGTLTDIYQKTNDTIKLNFTSPEKNTLGELNLTIIKEDTIPYVMLLSTNRGQLIKKEVLYGTGILKINYPWMEPGEYNLFFIADRNKNQIWDTGNYFENKQPESVYKHPQNINLRKNWTIDLEVTPFK